MEIHVKQSAMIRPAQETPKHLLPNSELDLVAPAMYVPTVYFYRRSNDSSNFFEAGLLKESLSHILVPFYPIAGRLGKTEDGGNVVECNGEGVLFIEAETDCVIDDLGDFSQGFKLLPLIPTVDDTQDVSSRPLLMTQ
ncbi:Hydroxycinnamoyl-CoA shikimate/quinate hydroxycinnamoyl transferase, partial [Melia azedarach]